MALHSKTQQAIIRRIQNNRAFRKDLAKSDFGWFFFIYFSHYVKTSPAEFHGERVRLLSDWDIKLFVELGFRGSAKSTHAMTALPIWAMIAGHSNFTVLIGDNSTQAKSYLADVRHEFEDNEDLIADWGPFTEGSGEWTTSDMVVERFGTKLSARGTGQKVRGLKFREHRPKLIVGDDLENLMSVRTREQRKKTYDWVTGDLFEAGWDENTEEGQKNTDTKIVLIGNLLHRDSLMARLKKEIENGERLGVTRTYPLATDIVHGEDGEIISARIWWKGRYPNVAALNKKRMKIGRTPDGDRTWKREYLMKIVAEEGQPVKESSLQFYEALPGPEPDFSATGVDLAISQKDGSDFTTMVSGKLYQNGENQVLYIMPNPVNLRLPPLETRHKAAEVSKALGAGSATMLFVEDVQFQRMMVDQLQADGLPVMPMNPGGRDKRARLLTAATYIQSGQVLFPRKGCEDLIDQILGFGIEAHDDLVDALVYLILGTFNTVATNAEITWFG